MNWLCWNCQGLGNHRAVRNLIESQKPAVIFLCETLVHAAKIEEIRCVLKFDGSFSVDRLSKGGGLAMLWRMNGVSVMGYSPNHIDLLYKR